MIVNLRGTSGSGKTTLARALMARLGSRVRVRAHGKKRILAYLCPHPVPGEKTVAVIGSYENPTGGCDTLPDMPTINSLVREAHAKGFHVFFEGLLISADQKWMYAMHQEGLPVQVVCIEIPIEQCVESVNMRRRAKRGPDAEPVNPKNTESKWHQTRKAARWLTERGVPVVIGDREAALKAVLTALNIPTVEGDQHVDVGATQEPDQGEDHPADRAQGAEADAASGAADVSAG